MNKRGTIALALLLAATADIAAARADTLLAVDAAAPPAPPVAGTLQLGTATSPSGATLGANNRYLTRDGKPWLPVMGEFHYSRSPASSWEAELRKMKAAGITIVASYVIWNHHEVRDGEFAWQGNRDLRRFVQLAGKVGLDAVVRIGPWSHAEVRYGGMPDWVVAGMRTRGNDPQYLRHVARLYGEIGAQLKGMLWKDGGPVVGIQLENEYNLAGPGYGAEHIAMLKKLARDAGMDVPFYTVTGWDGALYPSGAVTPVFGGYPDEPWAASDKELPPKETYAFRFDSRVSGDLGAQTKSHGPGTAQGDMDRTPFLGAEYGAGLPFMYRRRTVVAPDDIAAMLPVQLGSGVNLMGYYMFHGGRNPVGGTTLEESTLSGGYNDTPAINYDFQAPLGPDGQQRPVLGYLRPFHHFVADFGSRLAPMTVRRPAVVPDGPRDLQTPRLAVRSDGRSAFVFVNNHVRQYAMPAQSMRFAVKLAGGTVQFPRRAVDVPDGGYFIWPVNFDLDGTTLRYATAQPVARLDGGAAGITYVFAASGQLPVELALDAPSSAIETTAERSGGAGGTVVAGIVPGTARALTIRRAGSRPVNVIVLTAEQARQLAIGDFAGQRRLVLTGQQAWFNDGALELRSVGDEKLKFAVYPALQRTPSAAGLRATGSDGVFQAYEAVLPTRQYAVAATPLRAAQTAPAIVKGGFAKAAMQPIPEAWKAAATWQIDVPPAAVADDALLQIDFTGDIGRLFDGTRLADDWYYSGYGWQVGLRDLAPRHGLTLAVLPLRADASIYLPRETRPAFGSLPQLARVDGVRLIPIYRFTVKP